MWYVRLFLRMRKREEEWAERNGHMLSWGSFALLLMALVIPITVTYVILLIMDIFWILDETLSRYILFGIPAVTFFVLCYFEDRDPETTKRRNKPDKKTD